MQLIIITSAYRKSYWYSECIGHVFCAVAKHGSWIKVLIQGKQPFIRRDDCRPLTELESILYSLRLELGTAYPTKMKELDWDSLPKKVKKIIASEIGMKHKFIGLQFKHLPPGLQSTIKSYL